MTRQGWYLLKERAEGFSDFYNEVYNVVGVHLRTTERAFGERQVTQVASSSIVTASTDKLGNFV